MSEQHPPDHIRLCGGEYTIMRENGEMKALFHGEPWSLFLLGEKILDALFSHAIALKKRNDQLQKTVEELLGEENSQRDELLEALKEIVEYWDSFVPGILMSEMHRKARAVIAKVEEGGI